MARPRRRGSTTSPRCCASARPRSTSRPRWPQLRGRGLAQILCEGGPRLFGSLIAADEVDEVCLTVSPLLAGPGAGRIALGAPTPPRHLTLRHALEADGALLLRYARR